MSEPCKYCGASHGVRCPSIAAIEYHPDGTVRRVEFVQPQPLTLGAYPQPLPSPNPTSVASPFVARTIAGIPAQESVLNVIHSDPSIFLMNGAH